MSNKEIHKEAMGKGWNPIVGCKKISEGCRNCYAERIMTWQQRLRPLGKHKEGFNKTVLYPPALNEPLKRKKAQIYFVCSMSDLFQNDVPDNYIVEIFNIINKCPQHTFQILTKRAERMSEMFLNGPLREFVKLDNIWTGVTVENKLQGIPRIQHLKKIPTEMKYIMCEPLLEDLGQLNLEGIKWVPCGGESGRGFRPVEIDWIRNIRDQCIEKNIPFFFKQYSGVKPKDQALDGKLWHQYPECSKRGYSNK